ncbi:MAG: aquaporin [Puniceicoccales bacterium]|jgi:aquaporin Z|nr:aquaporin [Puniceicoccales bacterium]
METLTLKKSIVELIGTFFLVLTVLTSAVLTGQPLAPLAIGASLMVMIYAGGHFSGGHYNPAVSLGVWLRGRLSTQELPFYIGAQLFGAVLAWLAATSLLPGKTAAAVGSHPGVLPVVLAEFLFTFALVYVVLNAATAKRNAGTGFYGLAIGFTVVTGAVAVGGISGGAFNPAVAFGVSLVTKGGVLCFETIWQHLAGQIAAAVAASALFRFLYPEDK